jgi:hypothetical protein
MTAGTRGPDTEPPPYQDVQDSTFTEALTAVKWVETEYGGWALQADCPSCHHQNAIDIFVPGLIAEFGAAQKDTDELVTCACDRNHGAPAGKTGCGRWAYITPKIKD